MPSRDDACRCASMAQRRPGLCLIGAFDRIVELYGVKYDKAVACLQKDRDALLAFYDFPAKHWKHLRTTNPIESTFATVRPCHAVQARRRRAANVATSRRTKHVVKTHRQCEIPRWHRGQARLKPKLPPDPNARHQNSAIAPERWYERSGNRPERPGLFSTSSAPHPFFPQRS
jgi:Transposase, Mutator family